MKQLKNINSSSLVHGTLYKVYDSLDHKATFIKYQKPK